MNVEEILQVFENRAKEKYGSVFQMSREVPLHYNVFMRFRNNPSNVRLATLIKIMGFLDLKVVVIE